MIESELVVYKKYENLGYDVIKSGIPDLLLLKDGKIEFVEVKTEHNKQLNENQNRTIKLLEKHGFPVRVEVIEDTPASQNARNIRGFHSIPLNLYPRGGHFKYPVFPSWIFDVETRPKERLK